MLALARACAEDPDLELAGVWTHFATADELDSDFFDEQLSRFAEVAAAVKAEFPAVTVHAANSAAVFREPRSHFDMARCGVAVYGLDPFQGDPAERGLGPALSLRSYVADVKRFGPGASAGYGQSWRAEGETWVGVLPLGYGDGVRRGLSNNAEVLVRGRRHPLVGTVSMDNVTIDLGAETEVEPGDEAVLIGSQGEEAILAEEVAARLGTINYEVTCGISARVPRGAGMSLRGSTFRRAGGAGRAAGRSARPGRAPGSSAARCATRRWGGEVADLDLAVAGDPEAAAKAIAAGGGGHAFELSAEFATWRVVARDQAWQVDVTALRGETIEADLGGARLHGRRRRRAARRGRADRPPRRPGRPRAPRPARRSASAASPPTRCACCAPRGSPPSSGWRSTRGPWRWPAPKRPAPPSRPASGSWSSCAS